MPAVPFGNIVVTLGTPRCLTVAASDSGGGAGIEADLKAFAAAGCHGMAVLTGITAQNTVAVTRVHGLPPDLVVAQLQAVFDDIGVDTVKTGAMLTASVIHAVADYLTHHHTTLVLDPVHVASTGAALLPETARAALVTRLLPRASVVTPNLEEAGWLVGHAGSAHGLAEELHRMGPAAVLITGGDSGEHDHLFDGREHHDIDTVRHDRRATHGTGCTHSAMLAALLARGASLREAAQGAAEAVAAAVGRGLADLGAGEGPVDVIDLEERRRRLPVGASPAGPGER
ncbi:MAG TPA: bifunctional hydroxymethylpyrimidine kinase/phosphomethylpyrimidine kinase [Candidatus Sulfotelmatobacter sp.]|nr:bifunctional hydroxymethylpyrimidine kinase/phosphomethylpyrimidine kinase [Candidatus Sulfotelmatobacter sp.]